MDKYLLDGFGSQLKKCEAIKNAVCIQLKEDLVHTDLLIGYTIRIEAYGISIDIPFKDTEKPLFLMIDLENISLRQSTDNIYKPYWQIPIWNLINDYEGTIKKILFNIKLVIDFWNNKILKEKKQDN